jgi:hypothetical protein
VANWRLSPLNRLNFFPLLIKRHTKAANAARQISDARLSSQSTLMTGCDSVGVSSFHFIFVRPTCASAIYPKPVSYQATGEMSSARFQGFR